MLITISIVNKSTLDSITGIAVTASTYKTPEISVSGWCNTCFALIKHQKYQLVAGAAPNYSPVII